ncbi:MAG: cyclase family protein [Candidatus Promineifilaceae bacterium]
MNKPIVELIDLSHVVEDGLVTYPGLPAPVITDFLSREDSRKLYSPGTEFHLGKIEMAANTGTYIDSPFHRFAGGADLVGISLEKLVNLPGIVVSVDESNGRAVDIKGLNPKTLGGKAVLIHTGWSRHWNTERYFGDYPYLTGESAEFLRDAGAVLVGIDSLNIDDNGDGCRPVHTTLLEAGILIVEHLTNKGARIGILSRPGFRSGNLFQVDPLSTGFHQFR